MRIVDPSKSHYGWEWRLKKVQCSALTLSISVYLYFCLLVFSHYRQCDQKIAKFLKKLPENDFTRILIDFNTFTIIA